jgi:hypothetical protein
MSDESKTACAIQVAPDGELRVCGTCHWCGYFFEGHTCDHPTHMRKSLDYGSLSDAPVSIHNTCECWKVWGKGT